jgi:hypothetical protein
LQLIAINLSTVKASLDGDWGKSPEAEVSESESVVDLIEEIVRLANREKKDFIRLASLLAVLREDDMATYEAAITEAGIGARKMFYLREINKKLEKLGVSDPGFIEIGWTKTQIIVPCLTRKNVQRLIKLAKKHTAQQLKALVPEKTARPKRRCVMLYLGPTQYSMFEEAILAHGGKPHSGRGLSGKERALMAIIRGSGGRKGV